MRNKLANNWDIASFAEPPTLASAELNGTSNRTKLIEGTENNTACFEKIRHEFLEY
jgi:hypothetical protein